MGRNPDKTSITIQEGTISRIHAKLFRNTDGDIFITDLRSGI